MFTEEQTKALSAPLSSANVKKRSQGGSQVSYIEGWHVIAEANRVFGFDAWSRETVDLKCVAEREREIGANKAPGWGVSYIAKVRIKIGSFPEEGIVIREGCGTGHGIDRDLGQAHESALKEAETDAMKRAMMTFGNLFGLALYDKTQSNVAAEIDSSHTAYIETVKAIAKTSKNAEELGQWWNADDQKALRRNLQLDANEVKNLKDIITARIAELKSAKVAA